MKGDLLKSNEALSREAMWLSIFGVIVAIGFTGGLITKDWFLAGSGLLVGIGCLVRIIIIRRVQKARLAASFSQAEPDGL